MCRRFERQETPASIRQCLLSSGRLIRTRTHKFPDFQILDPPTPPPLYAHIMTSLWKQYIGVRKALDPPTPFGPYVLNEWPLNPTAPNGVKNGGGGGGERK